MWFILLLFFCMSIHAENYGQLEIFAGSSNPDGSYSMETKIHILVTDPLGRQTGLNPFVGIQFNDVPYTNYSVESIGDDETGQPGPESIYLAIMQAIGGKYGIAVFGIDNTEYSLEIRGYQSGSVKENIQTFSGYITSGTTDSYIMQFDPTPGAPVPVITKIVTFEVLRNDLNVAFKLNQIGDEKFVNSLIRNIDLAEKLSKICDKRKQQKDKPCHSAIAVLKLFVKRLELANKLCDNNKECKSKCSKIDNCDEEIEWAEFRKAHGRDKDFKDFFEEWDKDAWHKHKKSCKRFVSDEALKIITEDTQWLIKSLGGEVKKDKK